MGKRPYIQLIIQLLCITERVNVGRQLAISAPSVCEDEINMQRVDLH